MRRSLLLFPIAVILLVGNSAQAQQESGTIIVIRASPDHAVVAADSRASRLDMRRGEIVDDHKCKLLSFGDRLVFAASGYDARFTRDNSKLLWSTFDEAKNTYKTVVEPQFRLPSPERLDAATSFAKAWQEKMWAILKEDDKIFPPSVSPEGVVLARVFFGVDSQGRISGKLAVFEWNRFSGLTQRLLPVVTDESFQVLGYTDVLDEFEAGATLRAKEWHQRIDKLSRAKLVVQFDTSGQVGGTINAASIYGTGVKWLSGDPKCRQ